MAGVAAVVVAAGRGVRAGADMPKQFRPIGGESPLRRALLMFVEHREVDFVQPVIRQEDLDRYRSSAAGIDVLAPGIRRRDPAGFGARRTGGDRRTQARYRPDPRRGAAVRQRRSGLARDCRRQTERRGDPGPCRHRYRQDRRRAGLVGATLDRNTLRLVQTPQGFAFDALLDAHRRAAAQGRDDFTDDAALAEWAGLKVSVFRRRARQHQDHRGRRFRARRGACARRRLATCAPVPASTCMPSVPAITSPSAAAHRA